MPENNQTVSLKRTLPDLVNQSDAPQQVKETKYPSEVIPLPTKGWFYPEGTPLASGEIEIKQMTAKEEDLLANQELIKKGKVLDKLMEALIVNRGIKIEDILIPDKNAIFIAIRRLAYGDDYNVAVTCPQCSKQTKVNINLGNLAYKPFDFDKHQKGQNEFSFKMPLSGVTVTYKLLSQIDEQSIDAELAHIRRNSKENTAELTTRLKYLISSIDGVTDRMSIRKFVDDKLAARDSLALRKHMKEHNPDVDMTFDFQCSECDYERRVDVPIGASFLWPDLSA